eukprot:TRINITY_DN2659_c0_g4_i1.p6 TRINITY_DN2659_c0_g4~~TRINITY_DN2659_c0_g4_i1.p6  ORF type:complete len:207 (-),score=7.05 TRINITY_DN2659_c0_g4_i1:684-1304(-)
MRRQNSLHTECLYDFNNKQLKIFIIRYKNISLLDIKFFCLFFTAKQVWYKEEQVGLGVGVCWQQTKKCVCCWLLWFVCGYFSAVLEGPQKQTWQTQQLKKLFWSCGATRWMSFSSTGYARLALNENLFFQYYYCILSFRKVTNILRFQIFIFSLFFGSLFFLVGQIYKSLKESMQEKYGYECDCQIVLKNIYLHNNNYNNKLLLDF